MNTTRLCPVCKKNFTRPVWYKQECCSRKCLYLKKQAETQFQKECPHCHKLFWTYKKTPQEFCSKECRHYGAKRFTTCPECGKEFEYQRSWPRKYCSRECQDRNAHKNFKQAPIGEKVCEVCGQVITRSKWRKSRFCSLACFGKSLAHPNPHLQKRVTIQCKQCGKEFQVKQSHATRRLLCSNECSARWQSEQGIHSGENNPNWRGGWEPYYGPNWDAQRRKALKRDKNTCRHCGATSLQIGRNLDVHHIVPFRTFGKERYAEANELSNLISLCPTCHVKAEPR